MPPSLRGEEQHDKANDKVCDKVFNFPFRVFRAFRGQNNPEKLRDLRALRGEDF